MRTMRLEAARDFLNELTQMGAPICVDRVKWLVLIPSWVEENRPGTYARLRALKADILALVTGSPSLYESQR